MAKLLRQIYPVGHGGFASETIDNFTVVYDCGSDSHGRVEKYVDELVSIHGVRQIDVLVLSHFDDDHVNGIKYLLSKVPILRVYVPQAPAELKEVYDISTGRSYSAMLALLEEAQIVYLQGQEEVVEHCPIWEWIIKAQMTSKDWNRLRTCLSKGHIDLTRLGEVGYVESHKVDMNNAFKDAHFYQGSNAKGLAMISKPGKKVLASSKLFGITGEVSLINDSISACFYSGDSKYYSKREKKDLSSYVGRHMQDLFLLAQIPHHGSKYNSDDSYSTIVPSEFYFCHDVNSIRIDKNQPLSSNLSSLGKLILIRDLDNEIVRSETYL